MKISLNWLKDYINLNCSNQEIASRLTKTGLEVSGIESFEAVKGGMKGLVIGEVRHVSKHPNADKLKLTKIDVKGEHLLDIVCGAPNVAEGQKVIVATVGTHLFPQSGESFKINKSKIRGEVSEGMLCSEVEIGLGEDHSGILVLEDEAVPGTPLSEYYELYEDTILEVDLTPNRTDAISHVGVARDLCASFYSEPYEVHYPVVPELNIAKESPRIPVEIKNQEACWRYTSVSIKDVQVKESPAWLSNRLKAIGLRPINNVVDVTNYVMHELGLPLHAFDQSKINGGRVMVKACDENTSFTTLDGVKRSLSSTDLMICNTEEPMCIAGVFGGQHSGVTNSTTEVFLESACFNPAYIRKTAKRHQLSTDASYRFERGADPSITPYALKRAVELILALTEGQVDGGISDLYPKEYKRNEVKFHFSEYARIVGEEIDPATAKTILKKLEFDILEDGLEVLLLSVPLYRVDVTREIDVIEELVRIYGYDNVEIPEQNNVYFPEFTKEDKKNNIRKELSTILSGQGFKEIINNSLASNAIAQRFGFSENIELQNALSSELDILRPHMAFSMLETVRYNLNRNRENIRFFEFGKTYMNKEKSFVESEKLSIIQSLEKSKNWEGEQRNDFFSLKSAANSLLQKIGISDKSLTQEEIPAGPIFDYGLQWLTQSKPLLQVGRLSMALLNAYDIEKEVFYAEFNFSLLAEKNLRKLTFKPFSKFPSVTRDLALLIDENISFYDLEKKAFEAERKYLKSVDIFDVYKGKNIDQGKKSYALRFVLSDESETLTDKKIDKAMQRIEHKIKEDFNAVLR